MEKKYKFFWGGIFSNWYTGYNEMFCVDNVTFISGEQYMMFKKAMFFEDVDVATEILLETDPRKQKALGRTVKNFVPEKWSEVCYEIVKKGIREKFAQNPRLLKYLLEYKGYEIVEASPEDRIWGIGFDEEHAMKNIDNWGTNYLGKILTELSNEL
jgi:ribA/ribD-fused uncharacterized protein